MVQFIIKALLPISLITNITVEAFKKLLGDRKYSTNALVAIVAVITSVLVSFGYVAVNAIDLTMEVVITMVILSWASFIMATCGYDKIIQLLQQIGK